MGDDVTHSRSIYCILYWYMYRYLISSLILRPSQPLIIVHAHQDFITQHSESWAGNGPGNKALLTGT